MRTFTHQYTEARASLPVKTVHRLHVGSREGFHVLEAAHEVVERAGLGEHDIAEELILVGQNVEVG